MKIKVIFSLLILIISSGHSFDPKPNKRIIIIGKVMDSSRRPIKGAAIFIDKVKTNTVTDQHGYYRVKVKLDAKEILVFSLLNGSSNLINS